MVLTPLKNMTSSVGMIISQYMEKKTMFQTTNQIKIDGQLRFFSPSFRMIFPGPSPVLPISALLCRGSPCQIGRGNNVGNAPHLFRWAMGLEIHG